MGKVRQFQEWEVKYIKDNYKIKTDKSIAEHLKRHKSTISNKRTQLGLVKGKTYNLTDNDMDMLKDMYNAGEELSTIAKKLNITEDVVMNRRDKLGLAKRQNQWTKREIENLKSTYPHGTWDTIHKKLPNRSKGDIAGKASDLGIQRDIYFWRDEDLETATEMYLKGKTLREIKSRLDGRYTEVAIQSKLRKADVLESRLWTEYELDILKKYYETKPEKAYKYIDRDVEYIQRKASNIGLVHPVIWRKEECEYIQENYKTKTDYEMAEILNRTRRSVKWKRGELGLESYFYNHFGNSYPAKDGTICASNDELYIHNYLIGINGIHIRKEVFYKEMIRNEKTQRRFDWVIECKNGEVWLVEYFGMYDLDRKMNSAREAYKKSTRKKIRDLYKAGLYDRCIFIFPNDLKGKTLRKIFGRYIDVGNVIEVKVS